MLVAAHNRSKTYNVNFSWLWDSWKSEQKSIWDFVKTFGGLFLSIKIIGNVKSEEWRVKSSIHNSLRSLRLIYLAPLRIFWKILFLKIMPHFAGIYCEFHSINKKKSIRQRAPSKEYNLFCLLLLSNYWTVCGLRYFQLWWFASAMD